MRIPTHRIRASGKACLTHLIGSALVALFASALVFGIWYPSPYDQLVGGRNLFLLLISVDVAIGPLLTFVVFNPQKPRKELWRDITIVVLLQFSALIYGLEHVYEARPVFLAFEGDRFRVVRAPDIDYANITAAPADLRKLSFLGPRTIGVRLANSSDPDFVDSIKLDLNGLPPAFRPGRWVAYNTQEQAVLSAAHPLRKLIAKHPDHRGEIEEVTNKLGPAGKHLAYIPLTAGTHTDWVVLISRDNAKPEGFLHLDGW